MFVGSDSLGKDFVVFDWAGDAAEILFESFHLRHSEESELKEEGIRRMPEGAIDYSIVPAYRYLSPCLTYVDCECSVVSLDQA